MRAKIEKANYVFMFETLGEFHAGEFTDNVLKRGFFVCTSCRTKVHYKKDHFFSSEHKPNCAYVKGKFKKKTLGKLRFIHFNMGRIGRDRYEKSCVSKWTTYSNE